MTAEHDALMLWSAAFVAAQADMPSIGKDNTVRTKQFSYKYADLPSIIAAIRPVLKKHGLAFAQAVLSEGGYVGVTTRVIHLGGHIETFGPLYMPAGSDAQAVGSATSYARRYSLIAALGIAPDEDDDGQRASKASGASARPSSPDGRAAQEAPEEVPAADVRVGEGATAPTGPAGEGFDSSGSSPVTTQQQLAEVCTHPLDSCTEDKPEGGKYRAGFVRCTLCEKVLLKKEATA